jgi:hypothetical protein
LNLSPYEIALVAGGFGIIGALLGTWTTYRLSLKVSQRTHDDAIDLIQRQEFNKAASVFRDVFLPETTFLKHNANIGGLGSSNKLHEMLRAAYLRQLKAIETFKDYLSAADRESIYRAWDEYCHPNGVPTDENEKRDFRFNDYSTIEDKKTGKAREVALQKINKILEFAKFKYCHQ